MAAKSAAKIRTTLSQIFKFGTQTGFMTFNPVREATIKQKRRPDAGTDAGFVLPGKNALRALLDGAATFDNTGRAIAIVRTLMYGGLRMSELRGLARESCRLVGDTPGLSINQRADRYNVIGSVKSAAGRRTVDLGPDTAQALRIWLMAAPIATIPEGSPVTTPPPPQYAFPNEDGGVWSYPNFRSRFWIPLMNHCGLVTDEPADKHVLAFTKAQKDFRAPVFSPHMLRHVYASLQIEQGVTPKRLQKLIGHATLKMTLDTYGHLWPDEDADRARARGVEGMI
jgi:integrase